MTQQWIHYWLLYGWTTLCRAVYTGKAKGKVVEWRLKKNNNEKHIIEKKKTRTTMLRLYTHISFFKSKKTIVPNLIIISIR